MPAVALTDTYLRSLTPPVDGRIDIQDAKRPGLVLRVSSSGTMSWSYRYRDKVTGRVERLTLGRFPAVSLAQARTIVDKRVGAVAEGQNPRESQRRARAEHAAGITFDALADRFLAEYVQVKRPKSFASYKAALSPARKAWAGKKAREITRDDVLDLTEKRAKEAPIAANRGIAVLSKLFNWSLDMRDPPVSTSPVVRIPKPGSEKARTRTLRDDELPIVWHAFGAMTPEMGRVMKVLLLTGQRLGEVIGMRRDELIGLGKPAPRWELPGHRTKNRRDHLVPLSSAVVVLLEEAIAAAGDESEFVFASRRNPGEPFDRQSFARAMKRLIGDLEETPETRVAVKRLKADPPTPHDLRRTMATGLGALGVPRDVIKAALNHIEVDVTAVYARYDHMDAKRDALNAWAARVMKVVQPPPAADADGNVVVMRQARGPRAAR